MHPRQPLLHVLGRRALALGVLLTLTVGAGAAQAGTHSATLDGAQVIPAVNTPATGDAKLTLDELTTELRIVLSFAGLTGAQTAAHLHGPAAPGENAGILLALPLGNFDQTFLVDAATIDAINQDLAYILIHSTAFPGGEIRGQVTAQPVSVDASTWSGIKALYR